MIPSSFVGLVLFALVLAPGWIWVRVGEKRKVRPHRSQLFEAAELVTQGVVFTSASALAVGILGAASGALPDLADLVAPGSTYVQDEPYRVVGAVAGVLLLSLVTAYAAARYAHRGSEPSLSPASSVWLDVFAEGGKDRPIWVSAELTDGRVIEGFLSSYSTEGDTGERDVALQVPMIREVDSSERVRVDADRVVLNGTQIAAMWVRYEWERHPTGAAEVATTGTRTRDWVVPLDVNQGQR